MGMLNLKKLPSAARISCASAAFAAALLLGACATTDHPPLPDGPQVDLARYMGSWYVLAAIPLDFEKKAFDPVESYHLRSDGTIDVVFQYRKEAFGGELITHTGNATADAGSGNAVWGIQFFWPLRNEYRIDKLEHDYSTALIVRSSRDHAWILSREPSISAERMAQYKERMVALGYDVKDFFVFPQDGKKP